MTWLEVPDWRAWQPYAGPMTDTPDATTPAQPVVITADIDMSLPNDEYRDLDGAGHEKLMQLPETADADIVPFPAGWADEPDADPDADEIAEAQADHPSTRFPVMNEPVRDPAPILPLAAPAADHTPATAFESDEKRARRIEKESMSRSERVRRGW